MAAETLTIELCSPARQPIEIQADKIVLPGSDGIMTIMPGHTLFLTTLTNGVAIVYQNEETSFYAIHGGFAEILNDKVVVLADILEIGDDIDSARAQASKERAEKRIRKPDPDISVQRAQESLARSQARLQAHNCEIY